MKCPRCDVEMKCDCEACLGNPRNDNKPGVVQVSDREKDIISCGSCGLTAHIYEWEDLSHFIYDEERRKSKGVPACATA